MKKCYFSKAHKTGAIVGIVFFSVLGCFFLLLEIVYLSLGLSNNDSIVFRIILCLFLVVARVLCFNFGIPYALFAIREYEVSEKGIVIQYANRYRFFFSWEEIHCVCVLRTHQMGGTKPSEVIWCATKKIKKLPPNKTYFHFSWEREFLHRMSILTVEFSEDRLEEFKKYYIGEIPDYRALSIFE